MNLVAINDTDIECTKTRKPKIESYRSEWYEIQGKIEDNPVTFYYSHRNYQQPVYVYFEYDSCWYMMENTFQIRTHNGSIDLTGYIAGGGTFRIQRPYDVRENRIKIRDISRFEMLFEQLFSLLETIQKYSPPADISITDDKIELYTYYLGRKYIASTIEIPKKENSDGALR